MCRRVFAFVIGLAAAACGRAGSPAPSQPLRLLAAENQLLPLSVRPPGADLTGAAGLSGVAGSAASAEPEAGRAGSAGYDRTVARRRPSGSRVVFAELAPAAPASGRRPGPAAPAMETPGPASA